MRKKFCLFILAVLMISACNTPNTANQNIKTVTFMSEGKSVKKVTVQKGITIPRIDDPSTQKKNVQFDGWFKDEACTEKNMWHFNKDIVTEDVTLYAKYTELHTVTFHLNGAFFHFSTKDPIQYIRDKGLANELSPWPWKKGYTFDGFYRNGEFEGKKWDFDKDTVTKNMHLYLKMVKNAKE